MCPKTLGEHHDDVGWSCFSKNNCRESSTFGGLNQKYFASELTVELNLNFNLDFDVFKLGYFKRQFTTKVKADKKSKVLYPY